MGTGIDTYGYYFVRSGRVVCSACWRQPGGGYPPSMKGEGYAVPVFPISNEYRVRGRCVLCDRKVDGEVMRSCLPAGTRHPSQPGLTPRA